MSRAFFFTFLPFHFYYNAFYIYPWFIAHILTVPVPVVYSVV